MKKWWLVLMLSGCDSIENHYSDWPSITEYGIYSEGNILNTTELPQANTGVLTFSDGSELIEQTDKIPAVVGITFGYCYRIPSQDKSITITRKLVNPPMQKPDGTLSEGYEYQKLLPVENGAAEVCTHYTLEHEWEAVSGTWAFSILLDGITLVQQDFELYK